MPELTHIGPDGRARMVDIADKDVTERIAVASGRIRLGNDAWTMMKNGTAKKGDVASVAELAGIMGAKRTSDLIPLCHPLALTGVKVQVTVDDQEPVAHVTARVKTTGRTGVEMEALTAASTACLTIYDMLKAVDKGMVIEDIRLEEKSGGKSGDFVRD